ncbi:hypothetical protein IWQ60_012024, partial [Tieghemiomyces parasiticus]
MGSRSSLSESHESTAVPNASTNYGFNDSPRFDISDDAKVPDSPHQPTNHVHSLLSDKAPNTNEGNGGEKAEHLVELLPGTADAIVQPIAALDGAGEVAVKRRGLFGLFQRGPKSTDQSPPGKAPTDDEDNEDDEPAPKVGLFTLFRFSTPLDWLLMFFGSVGGLAAGTSQPLMTIVFADILQSLSSYTYESTVDHDAAVSSLNDAVYDMLKWFGILA